MNLSGNSMPLLDYLEHFSERRKCLKHINFSSKCGDLETHLLAPKLKEEGGTKTSEHLSYKSQIMTQTNDLMYALIFLRQAGERSEECQRELNNDYAKGAVNYEGNEKFIQNQLKSNKGKSAAFAATSPDGEQHDKIQQKSKRIVRYRCGCENHISPECLYTTKKDGTQINDKKTLELEQQGNNANFGTALMQSSDDFDFEDKLDQDDYDTAYAFIQQSIPGTYTADMNRNHMYCINTKHVKGRLDDFWILLDNQSIVHIFWNEMFLLNVCKTTKKLELHTNAGSIIIDEIGELPGPDCTSVKPVYLQEHHIKTIEGNKAQFTKHDVYYFPSESDPLRV
eukprot:jgi/Psemu1/21944/gm1.21944_g